MWWLSFFLIFTTILLWILIAPVRLVVHTSSDIYHIYFLGIGKVWLSTIKECGGVQILFFNYTLTLEEGIKIAAQQAREMKKAKTKRTVKKRSSSYFTFNKVIKKFKQVARSFTVKQFVWRLDTGNLDINAFLFPLSRAIPGIYPNIQINFKGVNELDMEVQVRPIRVLWAIFKP